MTSTASISALSKSGVVSSATFIVVRTSVRTLHGLTRRVRTSAVAAAKSQAASPLCRRQLHSRHRLLKSPISSGCAPPSRVTILGNRSGTVGGGGGASWSSLPNGSECNFMAARGRLASSAATAAAALVLVAGAAACICNLRDDAVCACNNAEASLVGSSIASCTAAAVGHAQQSMSTTSQRVSSDLQRCTGGLDEESEATNRHINNKNKRGCTTSSSRSGSISNCIPGASICCDSEQQRQQGDFCALKKLKNARENLEGGTAQATTAVGGLIRGITDVYLFDGDAEAVGKGSRGVVSSARHRLTGQQVAVKKLPRSETTRFEVMQEVMMLKVAGRHPNVVTLQAFFEDQDSYYIVMDLCEGGELRDQLVDKGRYSEGQAARIMAEVAEAVGYLHRHGIVHFDLKPENIMLAVGDDCVPEVRLADFGSAFRHHREMFMARDCTLAYSAPEVLARGAVDEKVDMWALGVVMWVLLTGKHPFVESSDLPVEDLIRKVTEGELNLRCQAIRHVSPEGKDLVRRLLAKNPEDRPSANQMLSHPWLRAVIIRAKAKNTTQGHQQRQ